MDVILAVFRPAGLKIYVVPVRHLLNAAVIVLPFNGKYGQVQETQPRLDSI